MQDFQTLAKLSSPSLEDVVQRARLFALMNKGRNRPVAWLSAPGGSGKTTLVASWLASENTRTLWYQLDEGDGDLATFFYYMGLAAIKAAPRYKTPLPLLTPEYFLGIPTFTRRFFEVLFSRLKPPFTIVFDNYQNVPVESGFHEVFALALETIPAGINVVIVSRSEPPPALARLRANNAMYLLTWDDIRFTLDESRNLLEQQGWKLGGKDTLQLLHAKTEGWAAGLILLSAQAQGMEFDSPFSEHLHSREVFDYFASQIFDKADESIQRFLLTTAFLPNMTAAMAEELTGNAKAGELLEWLVRHHYFTQRHAKVEPGYQFHALFREFLLARARKEFAVDELQSIRGKAAALLQQQGLLDEAAALLVQAADWGALSALLLTQAPALMAQGRSQTLIGWVMAIPEEIRNTNGWLLFWQAVVHSGSNPKAGLAYFEQALHVFEEQGDRAGALTVWSEAVASILAGWAYISLMDSWIDWMYRQPQPFEFPNLELEGRCATGMIEAMMWRRMRHPDFNMWAKRALDASQRLGNPRLLLRVATQMVLWTNWTGDVEKAIAATEEIKRMAKVPSIPPFVLIVSKWIEAVTCYWATANFNTGYNAVQDALKLADESGVHIWDYMLCSFGLFGAILKGDQEKALEFLDRTKLVIRPDNHQGQAQYLLLVGWYHATFGDAAEAMRNVQRSLDLTIENRGLVDGEVFFPEYLCRNALQNVLCDIGDYKEARHQFSVERELSDGSSATLEFKRFLVLARIEFGEGNDQAGLAALRTAMEIARRHSFVSTYWWWLPKVMSELCARALDGGIEVEHVRKIIRVHRLIPGEIKVTEHWPWPLKIYTLGRFNIVSDEKPLEFSDKTQQKPLELLKVLIAFGGKNVAEERIIDALWPDADGDRGRHSLKFTLHRLRNQLGSDDSVVASKGTYSLDPQRVWTDVGDFERTLSTLETALTARQHNAILAATQRAISLGGSPFLDGYSEPWILSARERLRGKYLRVLTKAAEAIAAQDAQTAIHVYEKALEADPMAEPLYQGLMRNYKQMGRLAEGLLVYRSCRDNLLRELKVAPSATTEALYKALQQG